MTNLFPIILAIIDLIASMVYLYYKDYARFVYWLSACSITISTIFIK